MDEKEVLDVYWKYFRALGTQLRTGQITRSEFVKRYARLQKSYLLKCGEVPESA